MMKYIGIDQYGDHYPIEAHPRKELSEQIGSKHVDKMYVDKKSGEACHIGYVIGGRWVRLYKIEPFEEAA